jgi:CheY-like chemotaxis protein
MSRRIFLADDSVTIQKVIELTFSDGDYEVQSVSNGDEAIAALATAQPDFIILDVHMPGANGYEVCRRAKQLLPGVPVLLLVGTFEPFDEGHAKTSGADSFLKKPFDSQELLQRVEELLAAHGPAAPPAAVAPEPLRWEAPADFAPPAFPSPPTSAIPSGAETVLQPLPSFAAEPDWGSFELSAEPVEPVPPAPAPATPFDREPAFVFEPDPGYRAAEEPVFALDEPGPAFALQPEEETAAAPAPVEVHDRFLDEPPAPSFGELSAPPAWSAEPSGFEGSSPEPELELELPDEPLLPTWSQPSFTPPPPSPATAPFAAPPSSPLPSQGPSEPQFTAPPPGPAPVAPSANGHGPLSDEDVERIARRVVSLLGDKAVREIAWEVVPDLAEVIIRDRLRELEGQVETL